MNSRNAEQMTAAGMRIMLAGALILASFLLTSCYSFTGASVPSHLKTVGIPLVDDQSGFGEPGLREDFTRALTDQFISDNSLQVTDRSTADAILSGAIVSVSDAPSVVQQGEQVSKRRVTMTARFTFQDMKLRKVARRRPPRPGLAPAGGDAQPADAGALAG